MLQAGQGLWRRFGGTGFNVVRLLTPGSRFDYEREAWPVWKNSVVALAVQWLGARFPKPPLRACSIDRRGDHVPLPRHPVIDRWNRPNPYYGRRVMETACGLSLRCDGNAYVFKQRARSGEVIALWWVPHERVAPQWDTQDPNSYIEGYLVRRDDGEWYVRREDMVHLRVGIDPHNERLGLSATKAQVREICVDNEASTHTAALLRNCAVPGLMIAPANEKLRPSKDDAERIKGTIRDSFTGEGAGDAIVLAGQYKVETVGLSPEALRLDKLPARSEARIAASMGVASMSLGLPDPNKTYANLAEANRASWSTITEVQEIIAEGLRYQLLPEYDDPDKIVLEYDYTGIAELNEDLKAKHDRVREDWKAGLVTLASAQELLGYEVDPDGERYYPNTGWTDPDAPEPVVPPGLPAPNPTADADGEDDPAAAPSANGKAFQLERWSY